MSTLKDQYHRTINYLRISVTDRCNLRCQYCMPEEGIPLIAHEDILRYEEILRLVRVYAKAGISKIRLTGGEPLVRKEIVGFVSRIAKTPGIKDLSITTNGVLLREFAQSLKNAGLKRINISLDTLNPEKFKLIARRDKFHKVWSGIEEALKVGLSPVKLNVVTINGTNHDEVRDFARLTQQLPLSVRFIEYMPAGENQWDSKLVFTAPKIKESIEELGELIPVHAEENMGPAICYRFQNSPGEIGFINPISSHFCESCNRIRLTPDGHLRTCLFSDDEIDLKPFLRRECSDEKLLEILNKALAQKPKQHLIKTIQFKKCQRTMSAIGG
ncbi:MAG: GTP 3',8-cyclase MoaA [Deltaproteobacteria bacterium]|nr:GTP 3',8-cyclase MoaA [Deltaproteobacteria bacterium]